MEKKTSILEESRQSRRGLFGRLVRKKIFWIIIAVSLIAAGAYYFFFYNKAATSSVTSVQKSATASKEDIRISISSSGKIVAKDGVELSFPVSGNLEVDNVYVKEGDKVKKGDKIASVKTESLNFELRSAYNNYQSALASYNSKVEPASESDVKKSKAAIEQAQVAVEQAKLSLEQIRVTSANSIANAEASLKTAADNLALNRNVNDSESVNNAYSSLLTNIRSASISATKILRDSDNIIGVDDETINNDFEEVLGAKNSGSYSSAKSSYTYAKSLSASLETYIAGIGDSDHAAIDSAYAKTDSMLKALQGHLYDMQVLVDATITFVDLSQSELDGFKSNISSNRSSVNSAILSLNNANQSVSITKNNLDQYQLAYDKAVRDLAAAKSQSEQNIKNSEISLHSREVSLEQTKNDYADLVAPLSGNDLASARSQLTSAAIAVDKAKYNMEQATLISPIDGVVSQLNYKKGDIILSDSAKTMATIINNDTLFIEANIEEADISKLAAGQKAKASFDAVDGLELEGEISFISLTSDTSSNGIVTYLVRVAVNDVGESKVREGMTADIDFIISEAKDVVSIPVAAVRNIGGKPSVQKADGSTVNVTTGFTDGKKVEIISGLSAGDRLIY